MELTHEEKTALSGILSICIEQFETSGGDIDYAGLGDGSPKIIRGLIEKLTTKEQGEKNEVYTAYAQNNDMTFIMQDTYEGDEVKTTECIGWYYGAPSDEDTKTFSGKLKAEYSV